MLLNADIPFMSRISNEENRRFEELVGTLSDVEKRVEKHSNKKRTIIIISSIISAVGMSILILSITLNMPILGVATFLSMVLGINFTLERFLK